MCGWRQTPGCQMTGPALFLQTAFNLSVSRAGQAGPHQRKGHCMIQSCCSAFTRQNKRGGDNGSDGRRLTSGRSRCENRTFCYVLFASHPPSMNTGGINEKCWHFGGGRGGWFLRGWGGEAAGGVYGFGLNDQS